MTHCIYVSDGHFGKWLSAFLLAYSISSFFAYSSNQHLYALSASHNAYQNVLV